MKIEGKGCNIPSPLVGEGDSRSESGEGGSLLLGNAKKLRTNVTDAEKKLWRELRAKRFAGYKFRRQVPMNKYIADFICYEPKLVIELDGGQHAEQVNYDTKRDAFFITQGFKVLRFWNNEMLQNPEGVLTTILEYLSTPLPNPLPQGERGLRGSL